MSSCGFHICFYTVCNQSTEKIDRGQKSDSQKPEQAKAQFQKKPKYLLMI